MRLLERGLDAVEPRVERAPAFGEQLDEQRQVVDARVTLAGERLLDPVEAADRVVREAFHLGQPARDRCGFLAEAVAERFAELVHGGRR